MEAKNKNNNNNNSNNKAETMPFDSFINSYSNSSYASTGFRQALVSKGINPDIPREISEWEKLYKEIYL